MRTIFRLVALLWLGVGPVSAVERGLPPLAPAAIDCLETAGTEPLTVLQDAAERGDLAALSRLACMYAKGIGVTRRELKAFEYFSRIADDHADDPPDLPQSRLVAQAFVALGQLYLRGIAGSDVAPNAARARELFAYAAAYFGDGDAQYFLARLHLDGHGSPRAPREAARWLGLAANKGQHRAQAVLGAMLFRGGELPRQAAPGLMWLTLARDGAGANEKWIAEAYDQAFAKASDKDRTAALMLLERHLRERPY